MPIFFYTTDSDVMNHYQLAAQQYAITTCSKCSESDQALIKSVSLNYASHIVVGATVTDLRKKNS